MKSADLFQRGAKPNEPVKPQNPPESDEPISVRKSHLSDRGNEFNRNNNEPEEPTSQEPNEEPVAFTIDEMLEMEDAELKSYGIDDPKTWKSYQRLLHKKENEWEKDKRLMMEEIANLKKGQNQRNDPPPQQPARQEQNIPLKPPTRPQRPIGFDFAEATSDPNSVSAKYLNDMEKYREDKEIYQDTVIAQLTGYVSNEQQARMQAARREEAKSKTISRFQARGMSPQDAVSLYDKIEQAYISDPETGADIFTSLFNSGKNGSDMKPANKNVRRKLPDNIILPPGVSSSTAKPNESGSKSFMGAIAGGNQTRKIIMNREKRR